MNGSMDVVGEYATLGAARAADLDVEAILVYPAALREPRDSPLALSSSSGERRAQPNSRQGRAAAADEEIGVDEPLTPREIEVLELLAEGLPNKAIAGRLRISDQTVKFHVSSISGKLGAANRTDAVRRAVRRGLITL
jgi:DNA-binding NarL/FixJ family response regulator